MDFILCWLMAFLPIVIFKIFYVRYKKLRKNKDSMVFTEAIGLPLTFLHPVVFFKSVFMFDWLGALITGRTCHDSWLIRILYPTFLFIPFFYDLHAAYKVFGSLLFVLWASGIFYVYRSKEFMNLPNDPTLLRNMLYFRERKR